MSNITAAAQHDSGPEVAFTIVPKHDFRWSRACLQFLQGVPAATTAQTDLAQLMSETHYPGWQWTITPGIAGDDARRWLAGNNETFHVALLTHRLMDDGFADGFFAAPDRLMDGLHDNENVKSEGLRTTAPVERKSAAVEKYKGSI